MESASRLRITFHGAVTLFIGLLCGYPTVTESVAGTERLWHTAHEELILVGVLLFAIASALPLLVLGRREAAGLVWSLIAVAYGFTVGLVLQAVTGVLAFSPSRSPILMIAFIGNAAGILGSMLAAALTIAGAHTALTVARAGDISDLGTHPAA